MLVSKHIILGILFSLIILAIFPTIGVFNASLIFLASVLIDFDHYLLYFMRTKKLNLKKAYFYWLKEHTRFYKSNKAKNVNRAQPQFIFHGIEFVLILIILAFFFNFFFFILLGVLFHLFLDYLDLYLKNQSLHHKTSQIHLFIKNKKLTRVR